ncbi:MAG: hypothetical protein M5U14_04855 [Acidimicrobiia bacterium]|nr:hypothetical protein [Acidimicrobiia bacterium]
MSTGLLLVAYLGAWNAGRLHRALPAGDRSPGQRIAAVLLGAGLALASVTALASLASDLLDLLDLSAPTARLSAGAVAALTGARDLCTGPPSPDPALPGWRAGIVPVWFPLLLSPSAGLLALGGGADHDALIVFVAAGLGVLPLVASVAWRADRLAPVWARVELGVHRLLAAALVAAGLALTVDGVFDL